MDAVINQAEALEYYRFERGCFQLSCPDRASSSRTKGKLMNYQFDRVDNHLNDWLRSIRLTSNNDDHDDVAGLDKVDQQRCF